MEPDGDDTGSGKDKAEDRFKKKVSFKLPKGHVDRETVGNQAPFAYDRTARQTRTGGRTIYRDEAPVGKVPVSRRPDELTKTSSRLARDTEDEFRGDRTQPGMAGALLAGSAILAQTSMKGSWNNPVVHKVVKSLLDELWAKVRAGEQGLKMGVGHGRCTEIGTISDYLWNVDPDQTMSVSDAQKVFEHAGAATIAHTTKYGQFSLTPACDTCGYVTRRLAIATISS